MQQQSFIPKTWEIGDYVVVNGKHGKIVKFDSTKNKVKVEHIDYNNEKYDSFYRITDLPPYPTPEETKPDEDTPPAEPEPIPAATGETKLQFVDGHTRKMLNGTKLVVQKRIEDDLYECRVFLASGGTATTNKTADQIEKWGHPADIKIEDVTEAVNAEIEKSIDPPTEQPGEDTQDTSTEGESEQSSDVIETITPPLNEDIETTQEPVEDIPGATIINDQSIGIALERKLRRDMLFEQVIVEDRDGVYPYKASTRLTELINEGWQLTFSETISIWIPASKDESSYVRTTVYWTLSRVVELSDEPQQSSQRVSVGRGADRYYVMD